MTLHTNKLGCLDCETLRARAAAAERERSRLVASLVRVRGHVRRALRSRDDDDWRTELRLAFTDDAGGAAPDDAAAKLREAVERACDALADDEGRPAMGGDLEHRIALALEMLRGEEVDGG